MRGPLDSSTRLMSPEEFSRRIYCSVAEVISFDPVTGVLSIQGSVTTSGSTKTIQITASDVTHFHWDGAVKAPEGFFELSTVEIRNEKGVGGWLNLSPGLPPRSDSLAAPYN
jgi:hypothetical protein